MICESDRLIDIIEDHNALETGLRILLCACESGELPPESALPTFNDSLVSDDFVVLLEKITGKRYH